MSTMVSPQRSPYSSLERADHHNSFMANELRMEELTTQSPKKSDYHHFPGMSKVHDCVNLVSSLDTCQLSKNDTLVTAKRFTHFYIQREVNPKGKSVFLFRIVQCSKACRIFVGVQSVVQSGDDVRYGDAWRLNLKDGRLFDD